MRTGLVVAILCTLPAVASAHGGTVGGSVPFVTDGDLVGLGSTWGLIEVDAEGVPRWTCEEALSLTTEPAAWYRAPTGRVFGSTPTGLFATDDGGCSWVLTGTPLDSLFVNWMSADPLDPTHLFALARSEDGSTSLWLSVDSGVAWAVVDAPLAGLAASGVAVGAGGQRLRIVTVRLDDLASVVLGSDNGGETWLAPFELEGWSAPLLLDPSDDGGVLYFGATSVGGLPFLLGLDADLTSFAQPLAQLEAPALAGARLGDAFFFVVDGIGTFELPPGGEPIAVDGGPTRCLDEHDGELFGCGERPAPQALRSLDGRTWEALFDFDDVEEKECPEGTVGAEQCPFVWDALHGPVIDPDDDDSAADDDDAGDDDDLLADDDDSADPVGPCDCAASMSSGWSSVGGLSLLVLLGLFSRRDRTPGSPGRPRGSGAGGAPGRHRAGARRGRHGADR